MPAAATKAKRDTSALIRKQQQTLEHAKQLYDRADNLLQEIVAPYLETCKSCGHQHLKPGVEIQLNADGKIARLTDNFEGETVVWGHGGVRRFGVKVSKS